MPMPAGARTNFRVAYGHVFLVASVQHRLPVSRLSGAGCTQPARAHTCDAHSSSTRFTSLGSHLLFKRTTSVAAGSTCSAIKALGCSGWEAKDVCGATAHRKLTQN